MSDEESLAAVLGGASAFHEPVAEAKVETKVEAVAEVKAEPEVKVPVRDESGKFAKIEEQKAEVKETKPEELQQPHLAAIMDERRRRQAAERRLAELESQQKQEPKVLPSVFDDEDGAIRERAEAVIAPLRGAMIDQSVELAKLKHANDWKDAEEGFLEAIEANPQLVQQFRSAQNPGEFVYQAGVYHREMSKYGGSVVAMRDAIRGESTAKLTEATARISALEKELSELKASKAEVAAVTNSLNNKASGVVDAGTPQDPEDLKGIVRFGKTG